MLNNGSPNPPVTLNTSPIPVPPLRAVRSLPKEAWPTATQPPVPFDMDKALRDYLPSWAWELDPMTPRQDAYLCWLGAAPTRGLTKGEACHLIQVILQGPPTYDQWQKLTRLGLWRDGITRQEAQVLCSRPNAGLAGG